MKKIAKLIIGLSVLTMLMVCMTTVSFADAAKVNVTVGSSSIIKENSFDFTTRTLTVSGDASETYGIDDTKTETLVTFADVLCTMCAEKYGDAFKKETAADYLAIGDGGWVTKWFGITTSNVGYAFNHDFNMSGSAFDEVADGTYIDILEMSNFSSPLTYFDQEEVTTGINEPVTLQLSGSSYGMTKAVIKPAEGKTVQAALVDEKGDLEDIKGVVLDQDGKITVSFDKAGIYYVSAYGEGLSKDYMGEPAVARIGLPLAKVIVQYDGPVASITVPFKSSSIIKENEFDYADTGLKVTGDMSDKYGFDDTKDPSVVTFADVMVAAHAEKFEGEFVPLNAHNYMEFNDGGWFTKWFGVTTSNVGYAFNRDFNMSGSAFDAVEDGTYIDVVEMTNFSSPLTYFDQDEVKTTVGEDVTLQLLGSSYGMKGEVIKPAEGKTLQVATVNKDGSLSDVEGATINEEGKVTLFFKGAGTYLVSAYGEGMSKDYMGEFVAARIGLPLTVVRVADAKPAKPVIKTAKRVSKTKGTVTWKKAKNAKKYEVAYKMKGAKKWTTKKTAKLKITLKLKAKKAYQVKVRSINGSAKSAYSKTKTIKAK